MNDDKELKTHYKHINKQTFKQTILANQLTRTMPIAAEVSVTGVEYYESASESDYYYESTSDSDCDCVSSVSEYRKFIARKNPEATALTVRKGTANSVGYHSAWESTSEDSDSDSRDSDSDFDEEEDYQKFLTRKKAEAIVSSRRPATTPTSRSRLPPTTDAVSSDSDGSTYDSASYSNSDIDSNSCNGSDRVMLSSAATVVVGPKSVQPRFTSDGKWLSAIVEDQKKQLSMRLKEKEYIETYLLEKQRQHMREQDDTKAKKSKKTEMHPNPKKKKNKETNKDKQDKAPEKRKKGSEEGGKRAANSETQNKWKESIEPATIDDTSVACKANTPQTSIETGPVLADSSNQTTITKDLVDGGKLVFAKKSGVRQKLFFWKKSNKKSSDWGGTQNRSTI